MATSSNDARGRRRVLPLHWLGAALLVASAPGCAESSRPSNAEGGSSGDDSGGSSGRFSEHTSCSVIDPPSSLGLPDRYAKYVNCSGVPVVGSDTVTDEGLLATDAILQFMLDDMPMIRSKLVAKGGYYVLVGEGETVAGIPEFADLSGVFHDGYSYEDRDLLVSASREANSLCKEEYVTFGDSSVVHELSHMIHWGALLDLDPSFDENLRAGYEASKDAVWASTYAEYSYYEYWAEGVSIWFGVNGQGPAGGDGNRNDVYTRADLKQADPALHGLIAEEMHDRTDVPGCVPVNIVVPDTTCAPTVDDIDGNTYGVTAIGGQCWMEESLKVTHFRNGDAIDQVTDADGWESGDRPAWTFYDNDPDVGAAYGALYNWKATTDERGLCPDGWHAPTVPDLQTMLGQLGGAPTAGAKLKATGTTLWADPNTGATNESGFTALPGGSYGYEDQIQFTGVNGLVSFWTTTEGSTGTGIRMQLVAFGVDAWLAELDTRSGQYVRCVAD
jgi:uncharacterized protein (TIGR02145 family)